MSCAIVVIVVVVVVFEVGTFLGDTVKTGKHILLVPMSHPGAPGRVSRLELEPGASTDAVAGAAIEVGDLVEHRLRRGLLRLHLRLHLHLYRESAGLLGRCALTVVVDDV